MQSESSNSVLALVRKIAELNGSELALTQREYNLLIEELWNSDTQLKKKYLTADQIPQIISLYGVTLNII